MLLPETGFVATVAWFLGFRSKRADDLMRSGQVARGLIDEADPAPTPSRLQVEAASRQSTIPNLPPREMAQLHARRLFETMLDIEEFNPGEAIDSGEMYDRYEIMCRELGWRIRPWNPVAAALTKMLGGKTYREIDNSTRKHNRRPRVYIVPPLDSPLRRPKATKKPRASKPKRLQPGSASTANRLPRAA